jgi:hypothetical protein
LLRSFFVMNQMGHGRGARSPLQTRGSLVSVDSKTTRRQVVLAAVTIAALCLVCLVGPLPLWAGQPSRPPAADAAPLDPVGWPGAALMVAFVLALCVPFRPYRLALRALEQARVSVGVLIGLTALVALASLLVYPGFGSDIFDYVGFERMWVVYGDNPLSAIPASRPEDWATSLVWYPTRTPAYGPLWAILTWPLVRLAGDSPALHVAAYKVLALTAYGACCWVIWRAVEPARRQRALVAFAWSPLVLFEVLGKVHNDVLPALAALVAVWLATRRGQATSSLLALTCGGLVKATALAAAPVLALTLWRRGGWRSLALAGLAAAGLTVVLYAPFWEGPTATLAPLWNQTSRLVWSPASLLILLTSSVPISAGGSDTLVRVALLGVWAAAGVWLLKRCSVKTLAGVAAASAWLLIWTTYLLTSAVYAHYLLPVIALAAVANDRRLDRVVLWLSIGGLAAYGTELLGLVFGATWLGSPGYRAIGSLVLLLPGLCALVGEWHARRSSDAPTSARPAVSDSPDRSAAATVAEPAAAHQS